MDARLALQYIEIDLDRCSLTYGTSPCTASIPTTGAIKCFNSKKTCQDTAHFNNVPVTLRFAVAADYLPADIACVPSIKGISFDPPTLSLGENLGQRASLTVVFGDHPDPDTGPGGDKNLSSRGYNPFNQGTHWGKFRARHPFVIARALRWITGFVGDALADMTTHHFVIDSFSGPTPAAEFTIIAKDVLKLADGDRALAPRTSTGFLSADITSSATTAGLLPAGIGNAEYAAAGALAIGGSEIVGFTRVGDTLTLTGRGLSGTVAAAHSAQDRVQTVLLYTAVDPANIISDLLVNYAAVPSGHVPLAEWQAETAAFLGRLYTAVIANPTPVNTLISELIQQAALALWWRDEDQTIGLQVLRGINTSAATLDSDSYLAGSLAVGEQPDKRVSTIQTYFAQKNPLTSLTDVANYGSCAILTDDTAEADYGAAAIKTLYSRWIPAGGRSVADRTNTLQMSRYRDPPRKFNFAVLRDSNPADPSLGQGMRLMGGPIQDATGADTFAPIEITRVNPGPAEITVEAEEMLYTAPTADLTTRNVVFDFNVNNVNLRTVHDSIYPTPVSGNTIIMTVNAGVIIGSVSTSLPAVDIGTWPAGVTVNAVILGRIEGRGGDGGGSTGSTPNNGSPGGLALYTRQALGLDVAAGEIWGGGGGGGAAITGFVLSSGSGGAGQLPGTAGPYNPNVATTDAGGASWNAGGPTGGAGGGPGLAGSNGSLSTGFVIATGGAAGSAIDGVSHVTVTAGPGDRRGPEIN